MRIFAAAKATFNVFLCDLFLFASNIDMENYADYNMPCLTNKHLRRFARFVTICTRLPHGCFFSIV